MAKKGDYQIPFSSKGDQLHYPDWGHVMLDNFEFEDTLKFSTMARGRSAAYFYFKRSNGAKVVVFMKDLCEMMPHINKGKITGKFTFTKRGQNYGAIFLAA
ncbi:hypothetical protein [Rhizobium azibense]|uniref:Uncharacterized protein n=1 Tax=Rhizobium azibense TaxID=1136135 RepID=A0A4R3REZ6_9HYPH|nr:hypothetical protein [Rhizobium azibense]TCU34113.1 hypothetical protein EV129_11396 [Rhizobium azibense]